MSDDLSDVKAGDRLVYQCRRELSLATVERLTATQIVLTNGSRFYRKDGSRVGRDTWNPMSVVRPTPELLDQIAQRNLAGRLSRWDWHNLPLIQLRQIVALLERKDG